MYGYNYHIVWKCLFQAVQSLFLHSLDSRWLLIPYVFLITGIIWKLHL